MAHHVLLLGGNGKVARLLTPMLLKRAWTVTSIVRDPAQIPDLQRLGEGYAGRLNVLVRSLEETWAIDRDAACHFIRAAVATPSVTKFVMISFITSRLARAPWWTEDMWNEAKQDLKKLERYYLAKVAADQVLYEESKKRSDFAAVCLRPGHLTLEPAGGVLLGKTPAPNGVSSRASVARLADLVLDHPGVKTCWLDMLDGEEGAEDAVNRCVEEGVNCLEGEPYYP